MDQRGMSSEALKLAAALLIAFAVFAILAGFAIGPKEAEIHVSAAGQGILDQTQNASKEILNY